MPLAPQVLCVGEALVDLLPDRAGAAVQDVERWTRCPGGAVANVAVGLSRLGVRTALVGTVGMDPFGEFLIARLAAEGVDVSRLRQTDEGATGLAFVTLDADAEPHFMFYRTRAADLFLGERDLHLDLLEEVRVLQFGTNALLYRGARAVMGRYVQAAAAGGRIVAFDPNVRRSSWADFSELKELLERLLPSCTLVKVSMAELPDVAGTADLAAGLEAMHQRGVLLPIVTQGARGAAFLWQGRLVQVPAPSVQRVDPTGAGDGFMAGLLFGVSRLYADVSALRSAGVGELRELITFACEVGARVTTQLGAMSGLPTLKDAKALLPKLLREPS